jgi:hypothetical protein
MRFLSDQKLLGSRSMLPRRCLYPRLAGESLARITQSDEYASGIERDGADLDREAFLDPSALVRGESVA